MYRLLIVDDEPHVADWLFQLFTETGFPELDIYKVYNAYDAMDMLGRAKIDILLTDINMPGMNGIQLMEKVRKYWPECRIIFLTGYNDFDYAYQAIENDVDGYVLKNEDDSRIIKAVEKAKKVLDESLQNQELITRATEQLRIALPLQQKDFLSRLMKGAGIAAEDRRLQFGELDIPLDSDSPVILLLGRIDDLICNESYTGRQKVICLTQVISDRYLAANVRNVQVLLEDDTLVWIVQPMDTASPGSLDSAAIFVKETMETVQNACLQTVGHVISFIAGMEPCSWENAYERLQSLKKYLSSAAGKGKGLLITDKSFEGLLENGVIEHDPEVLKSLENFKKASFLKIYLERGMREEFLQSLQDITACLKEVKSMNYGPAQEIYFSIAVMLLSYINAARLTEKIAFKLGLNGLMDLNAHESWNDATAYLSAMAAAIFQIKESEQGKADYDIIHRLEQYIEKHLHEDISLVRLAGYVYLNPSYLSRFFKQVTGKNLSEYIVELKVSKAMEFLEDDRLKISEISSRLGFESPNYFARFFKKASGRTPQDYRDFILTGKQKIDR